MLINKKAVKEFITRMVKDKRPGWNMTQVSESALVNINGKLTMILQKAIESHPTKGKTFHFELGE